MGLVYQNSKPFRWFAREAFIGNFEAVFEDDVVVDDLEVTVGIDENEGLGVDADDDGCCTGSSWYDGDADFGKVDKVDVVEDWVDNDDEEISDCSL